MKKCLGRLKNLVDWERFRPFFADLFFDDDMTGGRPHYDETVMMRVLVLQRLYGLSDQETEFQINDRTSFRNFSGRHAGGSRKECKKAGRWKRYGTSCRGSWTTMA